MDWSGMSGVAIAGAALLIISIMVLARLAFSKFFSSPDNRNRGRPIQNQADKSLDDPLARLPVPAGQERLATQKERDHVNELVKEPRSIPASRSGHL